MANYIRIKVLDYQDKIKIDKTYQAENRGTAYNELLKDFPEVKNIGLYHHIEAEEIEVFYTGGGIWIAENHLNNNTYATIDNDFIGCLTIYKDSNEEEKYTPENMLYSASVEDLDENNKKIYESLLYALQTELNNQNK